MITLRSQKKKNKMPPKPQTSKEYFSRLTIVHATLLLTQVMFAAIAYYLISTEQFNSTNELVGILKIIAPTLVFAGFLGSNFLSKAQLKSIRQKPALKDKLQAYLPALLIKWALLETPSLFSIVCFLLTADYFFLGLACLVMVIFFINRPTTSSTALDLELSVVEKQLIENPNAIVSEIKSR